jgi:DNA-binding CsgD family transcriptional regulator
LSGSTGLPGAADGFAIMKRRRGQQEATLEISHRDLEEDQFYVLTSNKLTGEWTLLGTGEKPSLSPEQQEILDLLKNSTVPLTPKEIAEKLGKTADSIRHILRNMEQDGLVKRTGHGKYTIAEG